MLGLSITAIGQRDFAECLSIYETLKPQLNLDFLELAVGSRCDTRYIPDDMPLIIHHNCLYDNALKIMFKLMDKNTWVDYYQRIKGKNIQLFSIHPPKKKDATLEQVLDYRQELENYLDIPVCLEVMPYKDDWLFADDFVDYSLSKIPLLLDISHINIWAKSQEDIVKQWVEKLLPQSVAIHISHNNGFKDSHNIIPSGIWFENYIEMWSNKGLFVTYESVPEQFKQWDRAKRNISLFQ